MQKHLLSGALGWFLMPIALSAVGGEGDPQRGAEAFRQCAACHSLESGRHLTGPSLAGVVGRAAGQAPGFGRYSEALATSEFTWDRETLDRWLADPAALVPGTSMRVRPVNDAGVRRDLIAFLEAAKSDGGHASGTDSAGDGRMGAMHSGRLPNLKKVGPEQRVATIDYCGDAYRVTLGTGKTYTFWEFNLRFKSDSSTDGPLLGQPAIVGQGMRGDRAQVVFADPAEISTFIREACPGE